MAMRRLTRVVLAALLVATGVLLSGCGGTATHTTTHNGNTPQAWAELQIAYHARPTATGVTGSGQHGAGRTTEFTLRCGSDGGSVKLRALCSYLAAHQQLFSQRKIHCQAIIANSPSVRIRGTVHGRPVAAMATKPCNWSGFDQLIAQDVALIHKGDITVPPPTASSGTGISATS
jgi:hypothetical protein